MLEVSRTIRFTLTPQVISRLTVYRVTHRHSYIFNTDNISFLERMNISNF